MNRDRIAALVALVAALLAGTGLPSMLGLGPQAVTIIGGLVVGFAATARAFVGDMGNDGRRHPNWRDILGAMLGCVAIGLGIEGVAVDQLDPDALASLSSLAAAAFAWQRGGGSRPPGMTGLALLVCACEVTDNGLVTFGFLMLVAVIVHVVWGKR